MSVLAPEIVQERLGSIPGWKLEGKEIARHYELLVPENQSRITFDFLNQPTLQHMKSNGGGAIPNPSTFEFKVPDDSNIKVIQIDKDCINGAVKLPMPPIGDHAA